MLEMMDAGKPGFKRRTPICQQQALERAPMQARVVQTINATHIMWIKFTAGWAAVGGFRNDGNGKKRTVPPPALSLD